jgi:hypothetical protein
VWPPLVQVLWVEFLVHTPVTNAPAALVAPAYWLWVLSIPACAAIWLFVGYRLITRDYPDPRFDLAWFYFTIGMLVLIAISFVPMIHR